MKTFKIVAVLATALWATLATANPAQAGAWAVTYFDPLPDRFDAGRGYTIGYWVLQHGSHPYEGELGQTGLKLVDEQGKTFTFTGVKLLEPAHYAAAVAMPKAGRYQVIAVQGIFREYPVGTLTVPGGLTAAPTPTPMAFHDGHNHGWGVIKPPVEVPAAAAQTVNDPPTGTPAAAPPPAGSAPSAWTAGARVVLVGGVVLATLALVARRRLVPVGRGLWRRARGRPASG